MVRSKKYIAAWRGAGFTIFFQMVVCCAFCQCLTAPEIYKQVVAIENDTPDAALVKLKNILFLRKQFEDCKLDKDSVYARLLHRAGTLEKEVYGSSTISVLNNTLEAARINATAKNGSRKFAVRSYLNLGIFCKDLKYYDRALMYFDSVVFYNRSYPDQRSFTISALTEEAYIYAMKRDYQKCIEISTKEIEAAKEISDSVSLTGFYYYRAKEYSDQHIWKLASTDIDSGLYYSTCIKSNDFLASFTKLKALYCAGQKDFTNAETNFEKSIFLRVKDEQEQDDLKSDYLDYGNYFLNERQNYTKATQYYNKAIKLCNPAQDSIKLAQLYTSMAQAAFRLNHLQEAQNIYYKAFTMLNVEAPANFLQNASSSKLLLVYDNGLLVALLINKTEVLLALYKQLKAQKYLASCLQTALVMDSVITQTRHTMLGEQSKLYWRDQTRQLFTDAIEACYHAHDTAKAFFFMEKSRAVLLSDKLNELGASAHLPPAAAVKEQDLQLKIADAQQKVAGLMPSSKEYASGYANYLNTKDTLEYFIKSLEQKYPAYYQYKYADKVPALDSLKQYLAKNHQSFVHYFMNDTVMYVLGITPNKTTFIKLTAKDFDSKQLSAFINLCSNYRLLNSSYPAFASLSQTIYTKLFQPLQLPKGNIAVCTDNFFIPFEALCTDANGKNFLLYSYSFSYVYSARLLMKPVNGAAGTGNFIGFAPVSFAPSLQVTTLLKSADALAHAAGFYSNPALFIQKDATRSKFFSNAFNYSVINIFSHAQADTSEQEPRLYMQDSVIYLSELQRLTNPATQFALLSACQTNVGKNATGEGIYSLARGFASAGIPSISATLWNADEQTVYDISLKFHEYLAGGMNKSEALQKAKIWFIENNQHSKLTLPCYWANMVLIGNTQPINLVKENSYWIWIMAAFLGVAAIVTILLVFKYNNRHLKQKTAPTAPLDEPLTFY